MKNITPAALIALLNGDIENLITAATPGGIEAQEAEGQRSFVANTNLPKKMLHGCTKEKLESMGIKFGEEIDDIFIEATLPDGWQKQSTDHSMWSYLLDNQSRKRATIFYKAAFYDRRAHIHLESRFNATHILVDDFKSDLSCEERQKGDWHGVVTDCGEIIFKTESIKNPSYDQKNELTDQAKSWLESKYPDYKNELAYWD